ncbi:MAG: quinone-interacting membrane-bound oxidoreductase complex subunit QmoC [Chloroflexota bacterium]
MLIGEPPRMMPDLNFKRAIVSLDAHDLSACYQCGTCSVVCPLSTADEPFPRKEMVWVQWGLKDRLLNDPAVWLCHGCGECNSYCPRDAKPANVMAALRDYHIQQHAFPRFMGHAMNTPAWLPALVGLPVALLLVLVAGLGHLASFPSGTVIYAKFIPDAYIEIGYSLLTFLAIGLAVVMGVRYWRGMEANRLVAAESASLSDAAATVVDIFRHRRFKSCEGDRVGTRPTHKSHMFFSHAMVFYGFIGLIITTSSAFLSTYLFAAPPPFNLVHPIKLLGNVSGIATVIALTVFFYRRIRDGEKAGKSTYSDWLFLWLLSLTTVTGFLSQIARLANSHAAYVIYFVHLALIFSLLVYFPYSKFGHLVYRTTAMLFARHAEVGRRRATAQGLPAEAAAAGG